jgi:hypothetical protein
LEQRRVNDKTAVSLCAAHLRTETLE